MGGGGGAALLGALLGAALGAAGSSLEPVVWHTGNRRFLAAGGYVLYPQIGDRLDLVCPGAGGTEGGGYEFYKLYLVGGAQARRCHVPPSPPPTLLLTCDRPQRELRFTIKFQEFSPNLWGHEFRRRHDYYIITTSDGTREGLENRHGGACLSRAMRVPARPRRIRMNQAQPIRRALPQARARPLPRGGGRGEEQPRRYWLWRGRGAGLGGGGAARRAGPAPPLQAPPPASCPRPPTTRSEPSLAVGERHVTLWPRPPPFRWCSNMAAALWRGTEVTSVIRDVKAALPIWRLPWDFRV
ncbi:ephrin-B3 isoform X1 [Strigops habroptila]|uniref:ephrin-B3 isoform X1 n=1 Tax=Strigops habroptila TaxID=2489341 RepID=UPI001402AE79|nr:ephrin-B3 isoform X1 [Strigops habroptila]